MGALNFRHHFADGEIAAVEITEVIGADAEATRNRKAEFRRRLYAGITGTQAIAASIVETERRMRKRPPCLALVAQGSVGRESVVNSVAMVLGDVLDAHLV